MVNARGASRKKAAERKALSSLANIRKQSKAGLVHKPSAGPLDADAKRHLRDDLLSKARYGKISPEEAEAEALAAGLAPFAAEPSAAEFDPMKEDRWSLLQAIAWIAWRDATLVMEQNPAYRSRYTCWFHRPWAEPDGNEFNAHEGWFIESLHPPSALGLKLEDDRMRSEGELPASARFTSVQAQAELWKALLADSLKAEAFDRTNSFVEIPAGAWAHLEMYEERNQQVLKFQPLDPAVYINVRFRRTDITSIWPRPIYAAVDTDALDLGNITEQHFGLMLSEEAYVPFSVAVCWIAAGGGRKIVSIKDEAEWKTAAKSLLSHLAAAKIEVIGCGDDRESRSLLATAFDSVDCPHPYGRRIQYDLPEHKTYIRCVFYSDDEHWKDGYNDQFFLEGKVRPHWTHLRVRRAGVLEQWPPPPTTANLEVACYKWLKELMAKFKHRPKLKSHLLGEARDKFPGLSKNQSERAWARATNEGPPGWRKRGPVERV
jgi:hypothetical protein